VELLQEALANGSIDDRADNNFAYKTAKEALKNCMKENGRAGSAAGGTQRAAGGGAGNQNARCGELWNAIAVYLRRDERTAQGEAAYAEAMQEYYTKCEAGANGTHLHRPGTGEVAIPDFYGVDGGIGTPGTTGPRGNAGAGIKQSIDPCTDRGTNDAAPAPMEEMRQKPGVPSQMKPVGPQRGVQIPGAGMAPRGAQRQGAAAEQGMQMQGSGRGDAPTAGGKRPPAEGFMAPLDGIWEPAVIY
jgi:hypothetical protein